MVLRSLGVQTTTISPYYFVPPTTRFIPTSQVRDILIHEAFRGFEVRYYLAVIVDGEAEVVVVFPVSILPGSESRTNHRTKLVRSQRPEPCVVYVTVGSKFPFTDICLEVAAWQSNSRKSMARRKGVSLRA